MAKASTKAISIGILISILIILIIYIIVMFELYKQKAFIFATYAPPAPPANSFHPLGTVTPMTQDEINERNALIYASTGTKPS